MAKPQYCKDIRPDPLEGSGDKGAEARVAVAEKRQQEPPQEGSTSGRSATRPPKVGQRWRRRRSRRTKRTGTGKEIPQGGHM